MSRLMLPLLLALLPACNRRFGGPVETPIVVPETPPEVPAEADDARAPTPFTAEQLREGMPVGTRMLYRITIPDGVMFNEMTVIAADEEGATIRSRTLSEPGGAVMEEGEETTAWTALRDHASFPAAATQIADSTIFVPAGEFDAREYVVLDPEPNGVITKRYHFVMTMPGPPVSFVVESETGERGFAMELVFRGPESEAP